MMSALITQPVTSLLTSRSRRLNANMSAHAQILTDVMSHTGRVNLLTSNKWQTSVIWTYSKCINSVHCETV